LSSTTRAQWERVQHVHKKEEKKEEKGSKEEWLPGLQQEKTIASLGKDWTRSIVHSHVRTTGLVYHPMKKNGAVKFRST